MQYIEIEKWKKETKQWTKMDSGKRLLWATFLGACHDKIFGEEKDFTRFLEKIVSVRAVSMLFTLEPSFLFVAWSFIHLPWCRILLADSHLDSIDLFKLPTNLFLFGICNNKSIIPIMYFCIFFLFWSVPLLFCYQSISTQFCNQIHSWNGVLNTRIWVVCLPTGW